MLWGFKLEFMKGIRTKKLWAVVGIMMIFYVPALYFMKQGSVTSESEAIGIIINYVTGTAIFFLGILAMIVGANAINEEIKNGTIRIALSKSITRLNYLMGKFLANSAVFLLAILITSITTFIGLKWVGVSIEKILEDMFFLNILLLLVMIEFIAMGYIISLVPRSPGTSLGVALAVFFIIYLIIPGYVDYKIYGAVSSGKISGNELQKVRDEYYTKYLFFSPTAQMKVIMDGTIKTVTEKTVSSKGIYERTSIEYVGIKGAIKNRIINLLLLIVMTLVYLGIATWRFLRMDLR